MVGKHHPGTKVHVILSVSFDAITMIKTPSDEVLADIRKKIEDKIPELLDLGLVYWVKDISHAITFSSIEE